MHLPTNQHELHSPFPDESVDRALLLATLPTLSTPHFLAPVITFAATHTRQRLVIVLFSRFFNTRRSSATLDPSYASTLSISHTESWGTVQRLLTFVYVQATKIAQDLGRVLMDVDVLLKGLNEDLDGRLGEGMDIVYRISGDSCAVPLPPSISMLRQSYLPSGDQHPESQAASAEGTPAPSQPIPPFYPVVALGGTFDHLHAGHKILLSMAAWITSQKIIVGVTDDALLQNKANKHVLEKLPQRIERVRGFLAFFKPGLEYHIVPINDVYGPTGWDPNIQALVVSKETLSGAAAIASHREAHHLPTLQTYIIDVISATNASLDHDDAEWLKQTKLSSTFIRQWIVDQSKQEEEEDEEEARVGGKS
ncbi:hypothetical protein BDQ12DRAFT_675982 [Crucibulum laeve]|uniref:Cytidyltransferase-like domain-containing protein n=1 Tax=Crucibulum laeve TaxID=68775 RepID=A0A5C3MD36_9AGAR|nr:hypothetical protein BDQ12DRAFT_675982 [Crucibulum laeve]